jgi:hypothetical protein
MALPIASFTRVFYGSPSEDERMKPIRFKGLSKVPSWSWIAYIGEISYARLPAYGLVWCEDIKLDPTYSRLYAPFVQIVQDCRKRPRSEEI